MPAARYIYVSDQGRVYSSVDEPTSEDFEYAHVGMLTILRLSDNHCYRTEGKWRPVAPSKLVSAEIDGVETEKFHSDRDESGPCDAKTSFLGTEFRGGAHHARNLPMLAASFAPLDALRRNGVRSAVRKPR
jgi:hypothetical protein